MAVYSDRTESDRFIAAMHGYELRKGYGALVAKYADEQRPKGKGKKGYGKGKGKYTW